MARKTTTQAPTVRIQTVKEESTAAGTPPELKNLVDRLSGGSPNELLQRRASNEAKRLDLELTSVITNLERKVLETEAALDNILDLGPDDSTSLRPAAGFDPTKIVQETLSLRYELLELCVRLDIARATRKDWVEV